MKDTIKSLNFGVEIELVNISRELAANAVASVLGGATSPVAGTPGHWSVTDQSGRSWQVVRDASLGASELTMELVTPILRWEDIETLQRILRALRAAGAVASEACGIHVHTGLERFNVSQICNLVRLAYQQEDLIIAALGVKQARLQRYTQPADPAFMTRLQRMRPTTREQLNQAWFGYFNRNPQRYDQTRYRGVNLASLFVRNTLEMRWFEGTTHAGKLKAYIQFTLALAARAFNTTKALQRKRPLNPLTSRFDFRTFLV